MNQLNTHADNSSNHLVEESFIKSSIFNAKKNTAIIISPDLIEKLENQFKYVDNLCIICFSEELMEGTSYRLPCGHRFCNQCMKSYLENLINQAKVNEIKCLHPGCTKLINEKSVKDNVSNENFVKYLRFKKRQTYLLNLNNGLVPCVFPNCEEWLSYREGNNPFLICQYGHRFCAKCKQDWHRPGNCQNVIFFYIRESYNVF
jgi:hypothetical protein